MRLVFLSFVLGLGGVISFFLTYPSKERSVNPSTLLQKQVVESYVELRTTESIGSGVELLIDGPKGEEAVVLTCSHVVGTHTRVDVIKRSVGMDMTRRGKVIFKSPVEEDGGDDLALIKCEARFGFVPQKWRSPRIVNPGETVWYCGTPMGLHRSLEKSIVNQNDYEFFDKTVYLINGNGWFGHSGCGVYYYDGSDYRLFGIICRIVWGDARTPILVKGSKVIDKFLQVYKTSGD